ncbi:S9 family peptidase, partial [bacterium]|nr:S9 family peptidase [bacterium]
SSVSATENITVVLTDWLQTETVMIPEIAFSDTADKASQALETTFLNHDRLTPTQGSSLDWYPGTALTWKEKKAPEGRLTFSSDDKQTNRLFIAYAATYIETARFQEITFNVESDKPVALYLDGKLLEKACPEGEQQAELTATEALHRGKHLLVLKTAAVFPTPPVSWDVKISAEAKDNLVTSMNPRRAFTYYKDYALFDRISGLALSPDGNYAAYVYSQRDKDYKRHSYIEIHDPQAGKLYQTIDMAKNVSVPCFLPSGKKLLFHMSEEKGVSLWLFDLVTKEIRKLFHPIKGLQSCVVSPDGKFLYYTVDIEESEEDENYELLTKLEERMTDWTDTRKIRIASLQEQTTHDLTSSGEFAVDEFALSHEGDKLIFTRRVTVVGRPYFSTEFWLQDISTGETTLLLKQPIAFETRPLNLTWLPGGKYVVYTSASHLTEKDETVSHNVSETDLYLLDIEKKTTVNLSGDALFTVDEGSGLHWNPRDKHIYFVAMVRGLAKVYKVEPLGKRDFQEIPLPFSYVESLALAKNGRRFAFTASSPDHPSAAYTYDIDSKRWKTLADPTAELLKTKQLASWERWNFVNSDGIQIDGFLYYPPDFSPEKKWPVVVYFYAGVWPQEEDFYFAFHWWAANGYVVYALTPVGAIGFGEEFSDKHVNDWGEFATRDVIEGTTKLLEEKPFLDAKHVGAYGGSYGGFSTMDLITKTDLFAAAISMYGISNIASYWGGGIWGYTYGDIALARSFPWNRRDVFVDKSPLFNADKIKTPLLLLHGIDDVNVPVMESEQMFTALKVQGKEVAYARFPGEDHGIVNKFENYITHRNMMLDWFDKYLKEQPDAWNARYKSE